MPVIRWREKTLLFKIEATYGTDAEPTGAANAVRAKNVAWNPMEGQDVDLAHEQPDLGGSPTIVADLHATLEFEVDLVGSGVAGTAPAFGPILRALGCAETVAAATSVTYNPVSSGHDAATVYLNVGGILYTSLGVRASGTITLNASGVPILKVMMAGLWVAPADQAKPTPDFTGWNNPKIVSHANSAFTIDGSARVLRSFTFDLGNEVEPRFLVGNESIEIVDRAEKLDVQIEAVPLATFNPYALAESGDRVPVVFTHEKATAGRIITLTAPTCQLMRPGAPTEAQGITEWPLSFKPLPTTGNDQWTLAFT